MKFRPLFALSVAMLLLSAGCGARGRVQGYAYDSAAAQRAVVLTGLTSDAPPGFVPVFSGVVPAGNGGPALVPVPGQGSGVGLLQEG